MEVISDKDRFTFEKYINKYDYKDLANKTNCKESTIKSIIQQRRKISTKNKHIYEAIMEQAINNMYVELDEINFYLKNNEKTH